MSLYMDVHNSLADGTTAADLAGAHAADLQVQERRGVRFLHYWVDETGGKVVSVDDILFLEADVVSPCALGAILSEESIARLNTPIIAGAANNQLETPADGQRLQARGILYAPDYVINAGGIINVSTEYLGDGGEVLRRDTGSSLRELYLRYCQDHAITPRSLGDDG